MHHFLKTVLLSCALLALGAMPSQSAESLRCVSAANPSGTWYIGMGAVGKAYTNMNPGTDVTMLVWPPAPRIWGWLKTVC